MNSRCHTPEVSNSNPSDPVPPPAGSSMESVLVFYESCKARTQRELQSTIRRIRLIGTLRLLTFVIGILILWLCRSQPLWLLSVIALVFVVCFLLLVIRHSAVHDCKSRCETLIALCESELIQLRRYMGLAPVVSESGSYAFDGGVEFADAAHAYSGDLDIFGDTSLFTLLNRTVTSLGKSHLASWLTDPSLDCAEILRRQESIRELSVATVFRQSFYVTGYTMQSSSASAIRSLLSLSASRCYFSGRRIWSLALIAIPVLWAVGAIGCLCLGVPVSALGLLFVLSLGINVSTARRIQSLYGSVDCLAAHLKTYGSLLSLVESAEFRSEWLREHQSLLFTVGGVSASVSIRRLERSLRALDRRFSLPGLLFNVLTLSDIRTVCSIEGWIGLYGSRMGSWFSSLGDMDALSSLGNFAFNRPNYVYPTLVEGGFRYEGLSLGHPLLPYAGCIRNDIAIGSDSARLLVVTGANMSGKSTYLRIVGVNYILACVGSVVDAASLTLTPIRMVTSLRTFDSLLSGESYFYAELKCLKSLIASLVSGERLFILLDEVLKGTNSADRRLGSLGLLRRLLSLGAYGIIATHDLSLGELAVASGGVIRNHCFESCVVDGELSFSYCLRSGIARDRTATYLMYKLGIIVE